MATYRKLAGFGKFIFDDRYSVSARFSVKCRTNGRIHGWIIPSNEADASEIRKRIRSKCRLEGKVSKSCRIICSSLLVYGTVLIGSSSKFQFVSRETVRLIESQLPRTGIVKISFGLANFIFLGNLYARIAGSIFRFKLTGKYSALEESLSDSGSGISAIVEVTSPPQRVETLKKTILDVVLLLSLARGTFVEVAFMEITVDGTHIQSEMWPFHANDYRDLEPLLEWRTVSNLRSFLQGGIQAYQALRTKLKLDRALRYCVFAKTMDGPLEVKFVTVFIALESVLLRLANEGIVKVKKAHSKKTSLVLRRLRACIRHYKLSDESGVSREAPSPNFARIRNRIVHTGDFPKASDPVRSWRSYLALMDLYQRLLLTILNYSGQYVDCANGYVLRDLD